MAYSTIIGTITLGLIFTVMSLGIFISFRILNIPDLTIDGSFVTGCAISAICSVNNLPFLGIILGFVGGCLAGCITGLLQTKLKIPNILAGILTMTGLYSINLRIMNDSPNISLFGYDSIFTPLENILKEYNDLIILLFIVVLIIVALNFFLKTQLGMSLRATGDNEDMVRASSINTDLMKIIGLALANGIVALSGALFTQQQGFSDIGGGIGMMVIGLASVILGEALIRKDGLIYKFISVVIGACIYRFILAIALQMGLPSGDLKLLSAALVTLAICFPTIKVALMKRGKRNVRTK